MNSADSLGNAGTPRKSPEIPWEWAIAPVVSDIIHRASQLRNWAPDVNKILNASVVDMNFAKLINSLLESISLLPYIKWLYLQVALTIENKKRLSAIMKERGAEEKDIEEIFNLMTTIESDSGELSKDMESIDTIWRDRRLVEIQLELDSNPKDFLKRILGDSNSTNGVNDLNGSLEQIKKFIETAQSTWLINPTVTNHFLKQLENISK